jgi:hypothetical protein
MNTYALLKNAYLGSGLGSLFHGATFFRLHSGERGQYFEWASTAKVAATVHFTPVGDGGLWRSPARGTFAGFASESGLRIESLFAFYDAVEASLRCEGAKRMEVLLAPIAHDPIAYSNQLYLLRSRGFEINQCDLNHSLEIDSRSLSDRMSYGNRKRLRKCQREGLVGERLPLSSLSSVYETLLANRESKGYVMSMTLPELQIMVDTFPSAITLFGCRDGTSLAAAGMCIRLSSAVLYVFYWGDQPGYESLSPVVSVAEAIYAYALEQQVKLLDIGASTLDRDPNFGLIEFKRGLGFTESLKVRLCKSL